MEIAERFYQEQGYGVIAGIDEVGRGPWAGPVVAAAVILPKNFSIAGLRDSKKLTAKAREKFYYLISANTDWGVGIVSAAIIDEEGIIAATKDAISIAISDLENQPDFLLVDGIKQFHFSTPSAFIKGGDDRVASIAAASIVAKVTRDRIMVALGRRYPQYGFERHKGYGTKEHQEALKEYGGCEIHRFTYRPVFQILTYLDREREKRRWKERELADQIKAGSSVAQEEVKKEDERELVIHH